MPAKKILTPYDFTRNQIQNAVLHVLAAAPSSPIEGQHYYDSTSKRWLFRTDATWIDPTARSNHSGTQGWATISGTPTTLSGYGITDAQAASAQLSALAGLNVNGLVARTGANTFAGRGLASTTPAATWTNTDGVGGNPTLAIADVVAGGNSGLMTGTDKTKLNGVAAGATANSTDAQLRDRTTHTGTQPSSTISDFTAAVQAVRLDQHAAPTSAVAMNGQRLTNLGAPTAASDAATRQYVDDTVAGLSWKDEVRVATVVAGTLATSFANGQTIDGVLLATGDRILIKNQAAASENGIYVVNASGAPTRSSDAQSSAALLGAAVYVVSGTANNATRWVNNNTGAITIGTTDITWVQFGAGSTYTAGNGLTLSGNDFNVGAGTGILVSADQVAIDTAVVVRKATALIGNNAATLINVAHNLGNQWVQAQVYEVATASLVECDVVASDANTTTFIFTTAPAANALRVVING